MAMLKLGIFNVPNGTAIVKISGILNHIKQILIKEDDNIYDCLFDTGCTAILNEEAIEFKQ